MNATQDVIIKSSYCFKDITNVPLSFFTKNKNDNFLILKLPKNRPSFALSSLKIVSKLKENNISFKDTSNGIVTFKRCYGPINQEAIKKIVLAKFKAKYKTLKITKIHLSTISSPSFEPSEYKLKNVELKSNLGSASGVVGVEYKRKNRTKKIYLRYKIVGTILVYKAKYNLQNGKILKNNDYKRVEIKFSKIPPYTITKDLNKEYLVRRYVKKDSILREGEFKIKKNLLKNDFIHALLRDENLLVEEDAHLLSDANIGDVVKIQTTKGKVFKAKILSLKSAIILE